MKVTIRLYGIDIIVCFDVRTMFLIWDIMEQRLFGNGSLCGNAIEKKNLERFDGSITYSRGIERRLA